MSYMFYECKDLPDISKWNTSNVNNMSAIFYDCNNLPDISKWNTSNVTDMSYMFYHCKDLPDISKWNTSNINNMRYMFYHCKDLPDISKWNTSNVINIKGIFGGFTNLPDISKWDTSKINNFSFSILSLESSPIFIIFNFEGRKIVIQAYEIMTFANLFKIFYTKAGISNDTKICFMYNSRIIDPNSNKILKDLIIRNQSQIEAIPLIFHY